VNELKLFLKKKPIKPVKLISFRHGPIESKKILDLPVIFRGNDKVNLNSSLNWKVTTFQEDLEVVHCDLWIDFAKTYSRQMERIELKQEQLRISLRQEKERIEQESIDREKERIAVLETEKPTITPTEDFDDLEDQMNQSSSFMSRHKFSH